MNVGVSTSEPEQTMSTQYWGPTPGRISTVSALRTSQVSVVLDPVVISSGSRTNCTTWGGLTAMRPTDVCL